MYFKFLYYLYLTLNLLDRSYKPFPKPSIETIYIQEESNHYPSIIKHLPLSTESQLSTLSSDQNIFIQAVPVYQ